MSQQGICVTPRSTMSIRDSANRLREIFSINEPYVDIVGCIEDPLTRVGLFLVVVDDDELDDEHAIAYPDDGFIKVKESVYERACDGEGRDRFTLAHEVGHIVLHRHIPLARRNPSGSHKIFEDSEWQANTFAAELLMPLDEIIRRRPTAVQMTGLFGVTYQAAQIRLRKLYDRGELK